MNSTGIISFASENFAGVHPVMMRALADANIGHVPSYGNDHITDGTIALLKENFGDDIDAYFTFNGTGANNFGLGCITEPYQSVYCADVAHLYVDESTAPECFTGCRLYPVPSLNGKILPDELRSAIKRKGEEHHPQPGVVSITQPTEYGTVYRPDELRAIKAICMENNLLLHVDGARYFNAAAYAGGSLMQMAAGADVLTLGGTKAGMMYGEAVVFFNPDNSNAFKFHLKRSMQLASKSRFIAAQFRAMLKDGLWQQIAAYTNGLAKRFQAEMAGIPLIRVAYPVQTNAVFLIMPRWLYLKMQPHARFYYWNEQKNEARVIFSFDNTVEEITAFAKLLAGYVK